MRRQTSAIKPSWKGDMMSSSKKISLLVLSIAAVMASQQVVADSSSLRTRGDIYTAVQKEIKKMLSGEQAVNGEKNARHLDRLSTLFRKRSRDITRGGALETKQGRILRGIPTQFIAEYISACHAVLRKGFPNRRAEAIPLLKSAARAKLSFVLKKSLSSSGSAGLRKLSGPCRKLVSDRDVRPGVRKIALEVLGRVGQIAIVRKYIDSDEGEVRQGAIEAMGYLKNVKELERFVRQQNKKLKKNYDGWVASGIREVESRLLLEKRGSQWGWRKRMRLMLDHPFADRDEAAWHWLHRRFERVLKKRAVELELYAYARAWQGFVDRAFGVLQRLERKVNGVSGRGRPDGKGELLLNGRTGTAGAIVGLGVATDKARPVASAVYESLATTWGYIKWKRGARSRARRVLREAARRGSRGGEGHKRGDGANERASLDEARQRANRVLKAKLGSSVRRLLLVSKGFQERVSKVPTGRRLVWWSYLGGGGSTHRFGFVAPLKDGETRKLGVGSLERKKGQQKGDSGVGEVWVDIGKKRLSSKKQGHAILVNRDRQLWGMRGWGGVTQRGSVRFEGVPKGRWDLVVQWRDRDSARHVQQQVSVQEDRVSRISIKLGGEKRNE